MCVLLILVAMIRASFDSVIKSTLSQPHDTKCVYKPNPKPVVDGIFAQSGLAGTVVYRDLKHFKTLHGNKGGQKAMHS